MSDGSTVWVFSRGAESVQVARLAASDGSWLLLITAFFALLAFSNYYWRGTVRRGAS